MYPSIPCPPQGGADRALAWVPGSISEINTYHKFALIAKNSPAALFSSIILIFKIMWLYNAIYNCVAILKNSIIQMGV
jgi:hypothetical protein